MTVYVVEGLEMIEVYHHDAYRLLPPAGHGEEIPGVILKETAVVKARERIDIGSLLHGVE